MNLQSLIEAGMSLVLNDPHHDLRLGFRCAVWSSLNENCDGTRRGDGHKRRVKLAALSIEKVIPLWESRFPADRTPRQCLELAQNLIVGDVTSATAERESNRLWTHCDDLLWKHEEKQSYVMVGYGAIQVIRGALSDEHFACEKWNDSTTDSDVDPYDHDSTFFAAVAYSGGATWEEASDPQKRLEFWTWWLKSGFEEVLAAE